jgi:hypothetical protein
VAHPENQSQQRISLSSWIDFTNLDAREPPEAQKRAIYLLSPNFDLHLDLQRCPKLTKHEHTIACGVRLETTMAEPESPAKSWKPTIY